MRNFQARKAALLISALAVTSLGSLGAADETLTSATTSADSAAAPVTKSDDLGTGMFSPLPFHLTLAVRTGYDDNVTTSNFDKQGSWFTGGNVLLEYDFGDPRTTLALAVGAGGSYYWDHIHSTNGFSTQDYDINTFVQFSLTHKASARLTLSTQIYLAYQTEPDFAIAQGSNYRTGNYFYTQDKFTVSYLWSPRFSTATSYTLGVLHYDDDQFGMFDNYVENTVGNEFRFLIQPDTTLVAEYRFEVVTYQDNNNDSLNHFILGGIDHTFNPRLTASLRAGAQIREYDNGDNSNRTSPYFEGTINYAAGKETVLSLTSRYGIEEPNVAFNPSQEEFRIGLSAKHNITNRISGSLGMYYEHSDYQSSSLSPSFTEDAFDTALTVHYAVTRSFGVDAGYNFTEVWSDQNFREYTRNRVWGGISFTF